MIDVETARELFKYDSATGILIKRATGLRVGSLSKRGYLYVWHAGKQHLLHRVCWLIVHGELPPGMIDHANGDPLDNRLENLRPATRSQNAANAVKALGRSGCRGVWLTRRGTYEVSIKKDKKRAHIGTFTTIEQAKAAYETASRRAFGEFAGCERTI